MAAVAIAVSACGGGMEGNEVAGNGVPVVKATDNCTVYWLKDNQGERLMPASLFPDASQALIDSLGVQDGVPASVGTFLMLSDEGTVLFDTGNGGENAGLYAGLDSLGMSPADIDYIYITHFHGDHIGGMMAGDSAVFANAQVYVPKAEYDARMAMTDDNKAQVVKTMEAYGDRLHLADCGLEPLADSEVVLPGGVVPYYAPGHTPGHTVYYVRSAGLLIVGDLMHGAAIQMIHPEINASFDMDGAKAAESRKEILGLARENRLVMAGMHLPEPGYFDFSDAGSAE